MNNEVLFCEVQSSVKEHKACNSVFSVLLFIPLALMLGLGYSPQTLIIIVILFLTVLLLSAAGQGHAQQPCTVAPVSRLILTHYMPRYAPKAEKARRRRPPNWRAG